MNVSISKIVGNFSDRAPSVVILMPAYNHEKFIAQAIESVLNQVTDFDVLLCILDDASTDLTFKTASIFQNKNRVKINLIQNETNLGATMNGAKMRNEAIESKCKYCAILEGDDYWTDIYKLQKQVDFLEANPAFVISFHNVNYLRPVGILKRSTLMDSIPDNDFTIKEVASGVISLHTASVLFRNLLTTDLSNMITNLPIGDYPLWLNLAIKGSLHYHREEMAVYRVHEEGFWTGRTSSDRNLTTIATINLVLEGYDDEVQTILKKQVIDLYKQSLNNALDRPELFAKCFLAFQNHSPSHLAEFVRQQMVDSKDLQKLKKGKIFRILTKVQTFKRWVILKFLKGVQ